MLHFQPQHNTYVLYWGKQYNIFFKDTMHLKANTILKYWAILYFIVLVAALSLGWGQQASPEVREELHNHIKEKREFYSNGGYFFKVPKILRRIKFPRNERCYKQNWMEMLSMGDPLANLYGAPIFLFSTHLSQTVFPCFTPPKKKPPIFIAFLSGLAHLIAVEIHDYFLFPAPHVSDD